MIGLAASSAFGAVTQAQSFSAVKTTQPPLASSLLDDPAWATALKAEGFQDVTTRGPAPLATTAYIMYGDQYLYVAFHCDQRNAPITAEQTTNNVGFGLDDYIGVGLDPSGNGSQVYYFYTTPRGIRYQQSSESTRYQPAWDARAARTPDGWNAVLVIPLKVIRATAGSHWRFNFVRHIARVNENYSWAYSGIMNDNFPPWPPYADARFWPALNDIHVANTASRPQPRAEVYGLESVGRDRTQFQQGTNVFGPQKVRNVGVDFTYPFTNTLAFVGTLNPDFSNVEVDQQIIAPQEFQRVFNEYRPFFAQGAPFLNPSEVFANAITPPPLVFYSPTIGIFDRGVKVEGTFGHQALGILNAKGPGFNDTAFGYKHATDNKAFSWWADGVQADHVLGRDATYELGFKGRNLANGLVDGLDYATERGSFVPDPAQARSVLGFVDVHQTHYEWNVSYQDVGPYYNPLDGITFVNDARGVSAFTDLPGSGTGGSIIKRFDLFVAADRYTDRSGAVREADVFVAPDITFNNLIHLSGGPLISELRTYADGYPVYAGAQTLPFHTNAINLGYKDGTPSPLDFGFLYGPFSTYYLQQYTSSSSRQITSKLNVGLEYDATRERFFSGGADGQVLRRISFAQALGPESNVSIGLRSINGTGGLAVPGVNFTASYHRKFSTGNELFIAYGTPASPVSLNRLLLKYVLRFGGGAGP
ncbi:MAG: DUF5916 domain-containing protein [Candidatus Eremiobacteraeota bacterium]|nr:DUF5916 domain-containing protein [Candidatus Eremiobacteraeota bacterium]